jgi:hypothetical protein
VRLVTTLVRRFDRWLFAPGPGSRLWGLRVGLTAVMAVRLLITPYRQLAGQPAVLFQPPHLIRFLDQMPSVTVINVVQVVGVVAAAFALAGRRFRLSFTTAFLSFLFLEALIDSRAKISHHQVTVLLAAAPLLLAPAVVSWRDRDDDPRAGWPPRVAMIVVAGAYFFCGLGKVLESGVSWVTSDNLKWVLASGARSSKPPTDAVARFVVEHDVLAHLLAFGTLAFELTFFVIVFTPRLRPAYVAGAAVLHTGIWVTLGLDYWSWVAAAVVVFLPWETLVLRAQASSASRATSPSIS